LKREGPRSLVLNARLDHLTQNQSMVSAW